MTARFLHSLPADAPVAMASARRLESLLGQTPVPPRELSPQQELVG